MTLLQLWKMSSMQMKNGYKKEEIKQIKNMKTINDELKAIALVCNTSEEFAVRAKKYLRNEKNICQPLMNDRELRELFRKVNYQNEVDKAWKTYKEIIKPELLKRPECKGLWYEVWIDLEESWIDKWMQSFQYMENKNIIEICVKYLNDCEHFYTTDYIDMLNNMIK